MKSSLKTLSLVAMALSGLAVTPAMAQNPNFAFGDLTLSFQDPASSTTLLVNIGAATTYRDATTSSLNFLNINTQLVAAFGATWYDTASLWFGAEAAFSNDPFDTTVTNGDPTRTNWVSRARNTAGANAFVVGVGNSTAPAETSDGAATTVANGIQQVQNRLEVDSVTFTLQQPYTSSFIDTQLPSTTTTQGTAFGGIASGIQARFNTDFGNYGGVTGAQAALDLYRILASTGLPGQVGGPLRSGSYEGSILIDNAGNLSYIQAPEPTSAALLGLSIGVVGFIRRRRNS